MPATNHPRLPHWLRRLAPSRERLGEVRRVLRELSLNTVCEGARCPNREECYGAGNATFMILGSSCTRNCAFCSVPHQQPGPPRAEEPERLARAAGIWGLSYVVVTSVTRDDLPDGGAAHYAAVVEALRALEPPPVIELLIPDFAGNREALEVVLERRPEVLGHNVETVPRLYDSLRPAADYRRSVAILERAATAGLSAKTGLMCGLGESRDELHAVFDDLAAVGVKLLTLGQYLRPTPEQRPVDRYLEPAEFDELAEEARRRGIPTVTAGPLVRSSYLAESSFRLLADSADTSDR